MRNAISCLSKNKSRKNPQNKNGAEENCLNHSKLMQSLVGWLLNLSDEKLYFSFLTDQIELKYVM